MSSGLLLAIGSLFYIVLLLIVYLSKHRYNSIRNKIYRYMLYVNLALLVTELISTYFAIYFKNDIVNFMTYRLHWVTGIIWFSLLYYYSMVFISDIEIESFPKLIKLNKRTKIMGILFMISLVLYFFMPFAKIDYTNISYIPGVAAYYVFAFCAFSVLSIAIYIFKFGKTASVRNKVSVWIMIIEMIIIFALQLTFPYIAISALGATLQMYFLYFNIENPDLKTIKELEKVKDEIERSNKAKSDFLFNMSHEIRSPMNAIVGFSETLLNNPYYDEKLARSDIKHISSAGNNLLDIINNILDISKIESGKETLDEKNYSLGNILMELSSIVEARLGDKPIKLFMDIDKNIPSKLYGDSTKLFQILLNILTNSVKYTEVGKIKLTVTADNTDEVSNLHFKISDTGYGIKKEDFDKLFSKFSRLDSAKSKEIEGTGLGLVITKKYVDLMGGTISFESEYEVGTTFYVNIRQRIVNKTALNSIREPNHNDIEKERIDCSRYKVLIVDDNELNLKVASRLLSKYKFNIETSTSGKDCIYKVKEGKDYDMIFLDHMMPEMDGIEVLHILKKMEDFNIPPIVALTANAITGMKEMYLKEGFDEYLSKPINVTELNKLILKYFDK